jgi:hypothetical protein
LRHVIRIALEYLLAIADQVEDQHGPGNNKQQVNEPANSANQPEQPQNQQNSEECSNCN